MANNEVRIKVILDSDEAKVKLAELKSQIDGTVGKGTVGNGTVGNVGSSNTSIGVATSPVTVSSSISGISSKKDEETGNTISNVLQKNGFKIGTAIGAAVGAIASKVIGDKIELSFKENTVVGGNNYENRIKHAEQSGGLSGAKWGAGIGGGLALGAIWLAAALGTPFTMGGSLALAGAATVGLGAAGYAYSKNQAGKMQREDERIRLQTADEQFTLSLKNRGWQQDKNFGMQAFDRQLQMKGSREMRMDAILEKENDLVNGKGENSITKLMANRAKMRANNDTESMAYKENEAKLNMQLSTYEQLEQKLLQERMKPRAKTWQGSDFSDSMSQKGLYIGAQVNVADANKPIVDILNRIERSFERYSNRMGSGLGSERSQLHGVGAYKHLAEQGGVSFYAPNT